jgi:hypothetical protein
VGRGRGGGEEEMEKGVRVMRGKEHVDGSKRVGSGVWQDTMMVWVNMFVFILLR